MLVKEYRIPLPLTVDEYRIAQLYMIAVSVERPALSNTNTTYVTLCCRYLYLLCPIAIPHSGQFFYVADT